jgi:hypothetical protein
MMRNFKARLKTLELKNPTPCTAEQQQAFMQCSDFATMVAKGDRNEICGSEESRNFRSTR